MDHLLTPESQERYFTDVLFPSIQDGKTTLLLGAGASITERKYLSRHLIELYSSHKSIDLGIDNIVEFVDILSAKPEFNRREFDDFVSSVLNKLQPSDHHKIIASTRWKEIFTTNFDLLLEKAFDSHIGTPSENLKLKTIKGIGELHYNPSPDEVRYIKLNGCLSNMNAYKLVFSSKDFELASNFYKKALHSLENLSPSVLFLSIGYSYSDPFSKFLLKRFDSYNNRNRKWILHVDPYLNEEMLPYFSSQQICGIKISIQDLFARFKEWDEKNQSAQVKRERLGFYDYKNNDVQVNPRVLLKLKGYLFQLCDATSSQKHISAENFYRGEEPNYEVIKKNFDVVRNSVLDRISQEINAHSRSEEIIIPLFLIKGAYGTGKTTFCYRLIHHLVHLSDLKAVAFEVLNCEKISIPDLAEIFKSAGAKTIVLFFNGLEQDSYFKEILSLRTKLSIEQFQEFNIVLIASIRDNILTRYKHSGSYKNFCEIEFDAPLDEADAEQLVEKLYAANLTEYRDVTEKKSIVAKILQKYSGDTLLSLINIVSGSNHERFIRNAYSELSPKTQKAFLLTSLIYRFHIPMPAPILRKLISKDWEEFRHDVLQYDAKGILIHEETNLQGTDPDILFRTRHPIVSEHLVNIYLPSEDKKFEALAEIVKSITYSFKNGRILVDILKAIRYQRDLSDEKVNKLFDLAYSEFDIDPHFVVQYANNLKNRNTIEDVKRGIKAVMYTEGKLDYRNHRLIHRRADLNFSLARLLFKLPNRLGEVNAHIQEARELFQIKALLDPFSSYSYSDFLKMEVWILEHMELTETDKALQLVTIEKGFSAAEACLFENSDLIARQKAEYIRLRSEITGVGDADYLNYLAEMEQKESLVHYALILKYLFYESKEDYFKLDELARELETHKHLDEVAKILLKHYGQSLQDPNSRMKIFTLVRSHPKLEDSDPLRFHYYLYIAESYNKNFDQAFDHTTKLRERHYSYNPEFSQFWKSDHNIFKEKHFEAIITYSSRGYAMAKVIDLQRKFPLKKRNYLGFDLSEGARHTVVLHFYTNGIRAELIKSNQNTAA